MEPLESVDELMMPICYPDRVKCRGQGLTFGYIGQPIVSTIDTRKAGRGELTVFCVGPSPDLPAFSELRDKEGEEGEEGEGSGVFILTVRAQDYGLHHLHIRYNRCDVNGSPFSLRVSSASLLTFAGPGLQNGVLGQFLPQFTINTESAGKGDIKVKIGGPRGAFQMRTMAIGKTVYCSYSVIEPGEYVIQVLWCGDPVPTCPFRVHVSRNLRALSRRQQNSRVNGTQSLIGSESVYIYNGR